MVLDHAEFPCEQNTDSLGAHRRTVDHFRVALFEKFGIKSKTGLVLFAMRWGLVDQGGEGR